MADQINIALNQLLSNNFISSAVALGLSFYAYKAGPELPSYVEELFENVFFQIFVGFMVLYMNTQNMMLSLVVSAVFIYGMKMFAGLKEGMTMKNLGSNPNDSDINSMLQVCSTQDSTIEKQFKSALLIKDNETKMKKLREIYINNKEKCDEVCPTMYADIDTNYTKPYVNAYYKYMDELKPYTNHYNNFNYRKKIEDIDKRRDNELQEIPDNDNKFKARREVYDKYSKETIEVRDKYNKLTNDYNKKRNELNAKYNVANLRKSYDNQMKDYYNNKCGFLYHA